MNSYIENGIFDEYKDAMIYVQRTQSNGILREGIIGKIDLEKYDLSQGEYVIKVSKKRPSLFLLFYIRAWNLHISNHFKTD